MSLMKSLPMVARTKVLQRNTPGDWSVKDQTSCTDNLHTNGRGKVHNHVRTHGSEGATEPGQNGPGPVGLGRPAQPTSGVGSSPPFLAPEGSSTLNPGGTAFRRRESHSHQEAIHNLERGGRSPEGDRSPRRKHPQVEKKEDTVGRVTMINGAMSSTLMG
jgi:hypothetical protein